MIFRALSLVALMMIASARAAPTKSRPVPVGTFIQQYLVANWADADWQRELGDLKQAGNRYLVFGNTADSGRKVTWYPTKMEGYRQERGYGDPVEACLRNAEKAGFRVFFGLNFHEGWWVKGARDPEWLYAQMREGNAVASELHARYRARYPKTFAGWYWVWEVDNLNFNTPACRETLANAIRISAEHVKTLKPALPLMLCPFMNYRLGSPEQYRELWDEVLPRSGLGKGDIFAPQDCVGAGGLTLDRVPAWFAALRRSVKQVPGLRFWCDVETFIQEDWSSAPLDRFIAQMEAVEPYVEACITFAWSHYYSPKQKGPGFHETWLGYLKTGRLESEPPTAPTDVRVQAHPDGGARITWSPSRDNIGVCGYYVYRDGQRVSRQQRDPQTEYVDKTAGAEAARWEVRAYDFAGNVSPVARPD